MRYAAPRRQLLDAALTAAARGWHVFPLAPDAKRPAVRDWERRATTDPTRIRSCWTSGGYGVGIATGPSGLVVVDLDTAADGAAPPARWQLPGITRGEDVFVVLAGEHDQVPPLDTYTVCTGRGGLHLYFTGPSAPALRNTAGRLGWKVDTRAHGGYVVGAGSTVDGRTYQLAEDYPARPLPSWLVQLLRSDPPPAAAPVTTHPDRAAAYLTAALHGEIARVLTAAPGTRNHTLYVAAVALGQLVAGGAVDRALVVELLTHAGQSAGLRSTEVDRTVASGLRAGANRPRTVAGPDGHAA